MMPAEVSFRVEGERLGQLSEIEEYGLREVFKTEYQSECFKRKIEPASFEMEEAYGTLGIVDIDLTFPGFEEKGFVIQIFLTEGHTAIVIIVEDGEGMSRLRSTFVRIGNGNLTTLSE